MSNKRNRQRSVKLLEKQCQVCLSCTYQNPIMSSMLMWINHCVYLEYYGLHFYSWDFFNRNTIARTQKGSSLLQLDVQCETWFCCCIFSANVRLFVAVELFSKSIVGHWVCRCLKVWVKKYKFKWTRLCMGNIISLSPSPSSSTSIVRGNKIWKIFSETTITTEINICL